MTEIRLLGPVELRIDGRPVELGAAKQRAVLAILALRANRLVTTGELVEGLWGERSPPSAVKMVQSYVSQLRRVLEDADGEIVTRGGGYELRAPPESVDALEFERLSASAPDEALALWRGAPLVDLIDEPFATDQARRLEDLWLRATEQVVAGAISQGRADEVIGTLDELVAKHPLRERVHGLRMRALYGAGRQAEALEAFRRARAVLVEEVGIEPGAELRDLHEAMLRQDPALAPMPPHDIAKPTPPEPPAREAMLRQDPALAPMPPHDIAKPAPPEPPARRRRVVRAVVATVASALLIGGVAFAVGRIGGPERLAGIDEDAVGRIDLGERSVVAQYDLGRRPAALAAGAGAIWVTDTRDGTLSRIDPEGERVVTIPVGADPVAVAFADRSVWVVERGDSTLAQVSPVTNRVVQRIEVGNAPGSIASGFGSLWVASAADQALYEIRPGTSTVRRRIALGVPPSAVAAGGGAVWVASEESGTVFRIEPLAGVVTRSVRVGNRPVALAAGPTGVWVVNRQDATVWRIDPATDGVTDTIGVGREPGAIVADGNEVWVATGSEVTRIDGASRRRAGAFGVGNPPRALVLGEGALWAAAQPTPSRHRGGTLRVAVPPFPFPHLEAGTYDLQTQQVLGLAYDGLVGYRRTGGTTYGPLVGNLAREVPEPSADGLTYVFRLRPGIRFSDGSALRASDFRASMEDLLRRRGKELPPFFDAIAGAPGCVQRPDDCNLSRGIVADDATGTVNVRLTRPDPALLHKLANPVALVAPAARPFRPDRPSPGTGPYRVVSFDAARGARLVRNPHFEVWSSDARPAGIVDEIQFRVAEDLRTQPAAAERGDVDVVTVADPFGPYLPPDEVRGLSNRYPDRLHSSASPSLDYMWLNVREPPFDDVRVRQALSFAVDRRAVAQLEGGEALARPTCEFVAPGHPGYVPACRYTTGPRPGVWSGPDLARARELVRASGTAGQRVDVWVPSEKRRIGVHFASLLRRLGYRSGTRVPGPYPRYRELVSRAETRAQMGIDGWAADFPVAADFATPFLCGDAQTNLARLCDRSFDALVDAARGARGDAALTAWPKAYDRLADLAPAVPLLNRRSSVFVSSRVGNYEHHPQFGVLLDQLWIR